MTDDPSFLESELRKLRAKPLDGPLLDRLTSCANNSLTRLNSAETALEQELRGIRPASPSPSLESKLAGLWDQTSTRADENVIPFPTTVTGNARPNRRWWAAAAAVAAIGAISALMVPTGNPSGNPSLAGSPGSGQLTNAPLAKPQNQSFVPAGFNRNFREAKDEGVVWQPDHKAHRVLRVEYTDRVTLKSPDGKSYEVEQPRVEYILTPEQTD